MSSRMRPFVVINKTNTPAPLDHSAAIELADTNKGFLPNRLSTAQRDAIVNPSAGLTIYNTNTNRLETWTGSSWIQDAAAGASVTINYSLTSDQILGCDSSPVIVVPSQGANTVIIVQAIYLAFTMGTTNYATDNNEIGFFYSSFALAAAVDNFVFNAIFTVLLTEGQVIEAVFTGGGQPQFGPGIGSPMRNSPIVFSNAAAVTGGDGTAEVRIVYIVLDV